GHAVAWQPYPRIRTETRLPRDRVSCHCLVAPSEHHRFNLQKDSQRNSDYPRLANPCQQLFLSSLPIRAKHARSFIFNARELRYSCFRHRKEQLTEKLLRFFRFDSCPGSNNGCLTSSQQLRTPNR